MITKREGLLLVEDLLLRGLEALCGDFEEQLLAAEKVAAADPQDLQKAEDAQDAKTLLEAARTFAAGLRQAIERLERAVKRKLVVLPDDDALAVLGKLGKGRGILS